MSNHFEKDLYDVLDRLLREYPMLWRPWASSTNGKYSSSARQLLRASESSIHKLLRASESSAFGVASDHPEVKRVIHTFNKRAKSPRFQFFGNVSLGRNAILQQLRSWYHVVLLIYGADKDRQLDIPNESESFVCTLVQFGLPGAENLQPDLTGESITIIGQDNVAIYKSDITPCTLDILASSKVKKVYLVGRRGPLQVAFTVKELRKMLKLPRVSTIWKSEDFEGVKEIVDILPRSRKRLLMLKSLHEQLLIQIDNDKKFLPIFLRSPKILNGREMRPGVANKRY
uniref:Uncharacterized protein n=1 Tax=Glossina morsitans morsitans TaxID=37546 RepID=A0A1B0FAG1_GLOMM